jgi:hypothetical protein
VRNLDADLSSKQAEDRDGYEEAVDALGAGQGAVALPFIDEKRERNERITCLALPMVLFNPLIGLRVCWKHNHTEPNRRVG